MESWPLIYYLGKNEVIKEKVQWNAIFKGRFNNVHLFFIRKGREYIHQVLKTDIHQLCSDLKDLGDIRVVPFTYFCVFSLLSSPCTLNIYKF